MTKGGAAVVRDEYRILGDGYGDAASTTESPSAVPPRSPAAVMRRRSVAADLRADALAHERHDLARMGMPTERLLREDQLAVKRYLESAVRRRDELDRFDDRRPTAQEFVRQTDGPRYVVSRDAEVDEEPVPGIEHGIELLVAGGRTQGNEPALMS